ncbi:MAG: DMT family transporter [Planctomycetes bacterium]|nr:DMT family transporter [Planctomycetota bacterium]
MTETTLSKPSDESKPADEASNLRGNDSLQPYLWMLLGTFSFACMAMLTREASQVWDWQVIAMFRAFLPMALLAVLCWRARIRLVFLRPWTLWMRSIAGSLSLVGTFYAFTRMPIADVLTITNMFPIWLAILSWPMLGEVPSRVVWLSALCGLAGVYLIQGPQLNEGNLIILIPLASSLFTSVAMIGLHRLRGVNTSAVVVHFSGVALVFAAISFFAFERDRPVDTHPDATHLLQLLGVGVAATVGQLLLTKAFTTGNPARIAVVGLMQVVFALILDAMFLANLPSLEQICGISLVLAPTAWLMLRERAAVIAEQP